MVMAGTFLPWKAKTDVLSGLMLEALPDSVFWLACCWWVAFLWMASCWRSLVEVILVSSAATISMMSVMGMPLMSYFICCSGASLRMPASLPDRRSALTRLRIWLRSLTWMMRPWGGFEASFWWQSPISTSLEAPTAKPLSDEGDGC